MKYLFITVLYWREFEEHQPHQELSKLTVQIKNFQLCYVNRARSGSGKECKWGHSPGNVCLMRSDTWLTGKGISIFLRAALWIWNCKSTIRTEHMSLTSLGGAAFHAGVQGVLAAGPAAPEGPPTWFSLLGVSSEISTKAVHLHVFQHNSFLFFYVGK